MRDDDFLFSLYPSDLIKVTHRKELKLTKAREESDLENSYTIKSEFLYYVSASISTGSLTCETHDGSYRIPSMGIKTLERLEKYSVDVLGEHYPVKRETRQGFPGQRV
jgi:CRISPR-associated endonuclease Csn1